MNNIRHIVYTGTFLICISDVIACISLLCFGCGRYLTDCLGLGANKIEQCITQVAQSTIAPVLENVDDDNSISIHSLFIWCPAQRKI